MFQTTNQRSGKSVWWMTVKKMTRLWSFFGDLGDGTKKFMRLRLLKIGGMLLYFCCRMLSLILRFIPCSHHFLLSFGRFQVYYDSWYIYIILQKGQRQIGWSRWLMPRKSMYFISKRDDSSCSPSEKLTVSQNFPSSWWNLWFTALHTSSLGMSLFAPWFFPPSPLQIVLHGGRHLRTHGRQQAVEDDVLLWEVQLAAQQLIGALARLHLAHWSTVPSWKWGVV